MPPETMYLEIFSAGINAGQDPSADVLFDRLCQFAESLGLETALLAQNGSNGHKGKLDKVVKFVGQDMSSLVEIDGALHELSQHHTLESNPPSGDEHISVTLYPDSPAPDDLSLLAEDFLVEVEDRVQGGKYTRLVRGPHSVLVTHLPTGTAVECNAVDISNKKDEAIHMLVARFVATHRAKTEPDSFRSIHKYVFLKHALLQFRSNTFSLKGNRNAP